MKTLLSYGIFDGEWFRYESKLCGMAKSLEFPHVTPIALYINELTFSYFNQWQFVMDSYHELENLIRHLNTLSVEHTEPNYFTPYDLQSVSIEAKCRDYAYLMLTSIKTLFDLFACLVDVTVNRQMRPEHKMPDVKNVNSLLLDPKYQPVKSAMEHIIDPKVYQWLETVCNYRKRLIHRGYTLKPSFGFLKSDDLIVKIYKGNFAEEERFKIGELFDLFVTDLPKMEEQLCLALAICLPELSSGPCVETHYRYGDGIAQYFEKGVKAI